MARWRGAWRRSTGAAHASARARSRPHSLHSYLPTSSLRAPCFFHALRVFLRSQEAIPIDGPKMRDRFLFFSTMGGDWGYDGSEEFRGIDFGIPGALFFNIPFLFHIDI